jgi:hypothetical protein
VSRAINWLAVIPAIYFAGALLTYGRFYAENRPKLQANCVELNKAREPRHHTHCDTDSQTAAATGAMIVAGFWPLYWSIELWD